MDDRRSVRGWARAAGCLCAAACVALLAAGLSGCGPAVRPVESTVSTATPLSGGVGSFPLTMRDDAGRDVTVDKPPARIVSLAPANTEIVYALGAFDRIVGVTTYDDYPAAVKDVPKVGDFTTPNLEAIAAAKPDVIFVTGGVQADVMSKLEGLGVPVFVIDPQTVTDVENKVEAVGSILGLPDKGVEVSNAMQKTIQDVHDRVANAKRVHTFVEIGWNPLYTTGPGTLLDDLITEAGGENVVKLQKGYVGYSVEQLVADQPDVYLGTTSSIGSGAALRKRPGYSALTAVKDGRVFALTDDLVSRPGPRIVQGLLEVAKALHPELFK